MAESEDSWQSSYMKGASTGMPAAERGRGLGAFLTWGGIAVGVLRCLMSPDEPVPVGFCTICALTSLFGWSVSRVCGQWQKRGTLGGGIKTFSGGASIAVFAAVSALCAFYFLLEAQFICLKAEKRFTCAADHILFMLRSDDFRVRAYADSRLHVKYTPDEIEQGYLEADKRALEAADYKGMGPFLAVDMLEGAGKATIVVTNRSANTLVIICDGPESVTVTLPGNGTDSFELAPGDYAVSVSCQGNYTLPPFLSSKHLVCGAKYKGVYAFTEGGLITLEDMSHK